MTDRSGVFSVGDLVEDLAQAMVDIDRDGRLHRAQRLGTVVEVLPKSRRRPMPVCLVSWADSENRPGRRVEPRMFNEIKLVSRPEPEDP